MNSNMHLFLELVANSAGLKRELSESGRAVHRFTRAAKGEFDALRRVAGSIQGQIAGIGVTLGAVQQMMQSAQLDKSLVQIGQTAGAGAGAVASLRQELFRMGKESGQGIEELKGGFDSLVQSGLNMKEAKATLDGINTAMAVTGARSEVLAGGLTVAARAFQFDLAKPGQALELLDKMTVAGRLGNAELQNLSDIFARVGVNANSAGFSFDKTLAFIEGLSQVERQPERLATLADSTLRVFTNMNYMASAQKATGIKFYSGSGSRRDPMDVLKDIKKKYDTLKTDIQRDRFIQAAFGKADLDTIKGLRTLLQSNSLNQIGTMFGIIEKAGGTLKRDMPAAISNMVDQAGRLKNALREAADGFIQPINSTMAEFISFMMASKKDGGWELSGKEMIGGGAAGLVGTLLLARFGGKSIGAMAGSLLKGGSSLAVGVAEGKALQAAAGVTPVFVTNWPGSYGGVPTPYKIAGRMKSIPPWLPGTGVAGVVAAGIPISYWLSEETKGNTRIFPKASREYEVMGIGGNRSPYKNDIVIQMNVDGNGRVMTNSNSLNTSIKAIPRGSFFDSMNTTTGMGY